MSFAASREGGAAGTGRPDGDWKWRLRAHVFVRRGTLDRLLAAGADPAWDPELQVRAAQITAPRRRRVIADSIKTAVQDAHRPPRRTAAAPIDRPAVRAAARELRALAASLAESAAPDAQGVALARQLVREPDSPLYAPGNDDALRAAARIAHRALNCQQHRGEETA